MDFLPTQIKQFQVNPLLASPRTMALLYAGAAVYISFIDPNARNSLQMTRQRLKHWGVVFSQSKCIMQLLSGAAALLSVACFLKTKHHIWLAGGALMISLWPYSFLVQGCASDYLKDHDKKLDLKQQVTTSQKFTILQNLKSWVNYYRGKVVIAFLAAGLFYLAQLKSTQNAD